MHAYIMFVLSTSSLQLTVVVIDLVKGFKARTHGAR